MEKYLQKLVQTYSYKHILKNKMKILNNMFLLLLLQFNGCIQEQNSSNIKNDFIQNKITLKHASNFKISYEGSHKIIEVIQPYSEAKKSLKYRLIPKADKDKNKQNLYNEMVIYTPVETFVCTSTTHIAPLDMLGATDKLTGFPSTQYVSSEKVRKQVKSGKTIELGKDNDLNIELLMELSPDLVMSYTMNGNYDQLSSIERVGIPVVMNAEYLEKTPLGRAEWIKFVSLFFNMEMKADSIFDQIEKNYIKIRNTTTNLTNKPTIMSGIVYGDTWYVPGGKSWMAKFFRDAGTNYLWNNEQSTGSLQLSFEAVYEKSQNAEYWIGAANYFSLNELNNVDYRYTNFKAFETKNIYSYNARVIKNGGNDYFESGFSRPDIILSDLVKILHPELLPEHNLYYFRKLDEK